MTVEIEDALAERLRARAEARGLTLEAYLADLGEETPPQEPPARTTSVEGAERVEGDRPHIAWTPERWQAWKASLHEFAERVKPGPIPEGATSFESLYESED